MLLAIPSRFEPRHCGQSSHGAGATGKNWPAPTPSKKHAVQRTLRMAHLHRLPFLARYAVLRLDCGCSPDSHGAVRAGRGQELPVRGKGEGTDSARLSAEVGKFLSR